MPKSSGRRLSESRPVVEFDNNGVTEITKTEQYLDRIGTFTRNRIPFRRRSDGEMEDPETNPPTAGPGECDTTEPLKEFTIK